MLHSLLIQAKEGQYNEKERTPMHILSLHNYYSSCFSKIVSVIHSEILELLSLNQMLCNGNCQFFFFSTCIIYAKGLVLGLVGRNDYDINL